MMMTIGVMVMVIEIVLLSCARPTLWSIHKHIYTETSKHQKRPMFISDDPDKAPPQKRQYTQNGPACVNFVYYICVMNWTPSGRPSWVHCYSSKTIGTFHRYLACCLYNASKQNTMGRASNGCRGSHPFYRRRNDRQAIFSAFYFCFVYFFLLILYIYIGIGAGARLRFGADLTKLSIRNGRMRCWTEYDAIFRCVWI